MTQATALAPVRGRARIEVLDILRGIAILGIFYMNIQFMAARVYLSMHDIRAIGWTAADRDTWAAIAVLWEGTQRCLLEFLFGAGMMVLTAKAMEPTGPVAIADLYYRRNLWLLAFGLFDIFVLLWVGDILHIYALAALFLFPFRKLGPKTLVALGLGFALYTAASGGLDYAERAALIDRAHVAESKQAARQPLLAVDKQALADWRKKLDRQPTPELRKSIAAEEKAHAGGGWLPYARFMWSTWMTFIVGKGFLVLTVIEAFCAMLIGIALWKWGVIQGRRSSAFYGWLAFAGYAIGFTFRAIGVSEVFTFAPGAKTIWMTSEFARLAVGLGHVALVNLAVRTTVGRAILAPFRAAGRFAFSLYFCEQFIGLYILFAPWGPGLWGRCGWAGQAAIATGVAAFLLVLANIWARFFAMGPLEWLWRSLAYVERQPFRHRPGAADEPAGDPLGPTLVAA